MLYASGGPSRNCDGISRRSFLSAGTLGLGSFGLADLLRAESLNQKFIKQIHHSYSLGRRAASNGHD